MKRPSRAELDKKKTELTTALPPVEQAPHNSELAALQEKASYATAPTHDETPAEIDHASKFPAILETTRIDDCEYRPFFFFFYLVQLQLTNLFQTILFPTIKLKVRLRTLASLLNLRKRQH
jgi:hypothetical protein